MSKLAIKTGKRRRQKEDSGKRLDHGHKHGQIAMVGSCTNSPQYLLELGFLFNLKSYMTKYWFKKRAINSSYITAKNTREITLALEMRLEETGGD